MACHFIDSVNSRLRTRFLSFPDAPVSKVLFDLHGGKRGLLVNSANLCSKKRRAKVAMEGQNGRAHRFQPVVKTSCKGKKGKAGKRRSARR